MPRPKKMPDSTPNAPIYQFKIRLEPIRLPDAAHRFIERTILIESNRTFYDLHMAIQIAMGWKNCHLYAFEEGKRGGGYRVETFEGIGDFFQPEEGTQDAKKTPINDFFNQVKQSLTYLYDFGDSWEHLVRLEKIVETAPKTVYPVCLSGHNACPPEDCGGVYGYMHLLEVLQNPKSEDYADMCDWLGIDEGSEWQPYAFDLDAVNDRLKRHFAKSKPKASKANKKDAEKQSVFADDDDPKLKTTSQPKKQQAKVIQIGAPKKPLLINLSNHPSDKWSEPQRSAALRDYSGIEDIPFPQISARAELIDVMAMVYDYVEAVQEKAKGREAVVHVMGEMTFTLHMCMALANHGILSVASTSERITVDKGNGVKEATFSFVQFRPYVLPEMLKPLSVQDFIDTIAENSEEEGLSDFLKTLMSMEEDDDDTPTLPRRRGRPRKK